MSVGMDWTSHALHFPGRSEAPAAAPAAAAASCGGRAARRTKTTTKRDEAMEISLSLCGMDLGGNWEGVDMVFIWTRKKIKKKKKRKNKLKGEILVLG